MKIKYINRILTKQCKWKKSKSVTITSQGDGCTTDIYKDFKKKTDFILLIKKMSYFCINNFVKYNC